MKIRTLALATLALAAGAQAQAALSLTGYTQFYIGGSSALTPVIKGVLGANCNATGYTTYADNADGKSNFLFTCTLKAGSGLAKAISGNNTATPNIAVFKRDAGGSAMGVNPIATNTAVGFLDAATIDTATKTGAQTNMVVPQMGASDVEPALLQEPLNLVAGTSALTATQLGTLNVKTALLQTFGVAVNASLYADLQTAQGLTGAAVPSIPTAWIQSLVNKGGLGGAAITWGTLLGNTDGSTVNICRRAPGSGTQAGAQLLFSPYGETPMNHAEDDDGSFVTVTEGGSTGNVKTCLNNVTGAGNYALGWVGYENKPGSSDTWKFVKLDGVTADISNALNGRYAYAFESTINYKKTLSGTPLALVNAFYAAMNTPAVLSSLSADLQSAVYPAGLANVTRRGDSRNPLKYFQ
ncbi:MAG: hypothetical protein RI907_1998 [Pseudomonadota bacterium]|jgi:hypothetical protein